ncbi:MAG: 4Fe-4S binding protein [Dehalococcoidales bacterium]|nr:4Fe-4S binding protein [Dehalococcoidales bacterium]
MRVDKGRCEGCLECVAYCPVAAIKVVSSEFRVVIDEEECVECGCCLRSGVCEDQALWQPELTWPRIIRAQFSDPCVAHPSTDVTGRGTEETKTNDVTGRYRRGYIGIAAELGRPGIGTRLEDVEKVAQAVLSLGVGFEEDNPTYDLFADVTTGELRDDVRQERVLSAILEFSTTVAKAPQVLAALAKVAGEVDTVISVDIASRLEVDGGVPAERVAREAGFEIRPNGKSNLGLGRPAAAV